MSTEGEKAQTIDQQDSAGEVDEQQGGQQNVQQGVQASEEPENILKVNSDPWPIHLKRKAGTRDEFEVVKGSESTQNKTLTLLDLRKRIEPWLTGLVQAEHLCLLVGSGLTHAVHWLARGKPATGMNGMLGTEFRQEIEASAKASARRAGRDEGNLEDQIRVANELRRGLQILGKRQVGNESAESLAKKLKEEIEGALGKLAEGVLLSERNIATAPTEDDAFAKAVETASQNGGSEADVKKEDLFNRDRALRALISFLMSFASRTGTRERLHVFTTNYDRLVEEGAELVGLYLIDRFVGTLSPIFRSSRLQLDLHYNPPGIRGEPRYLEGVARFTKLHGSLDWVQVRGDIRRIGLPFGATSVKPYLKAPGLDGSTAHELLIYPNPAKDRETSDYPYAELFRDFAAAICRPNTTLVTYGYSFGDEHINRVIRDMLTIVSTQLVIITRDDPLKRISEFIAERPSQVSVLIGPVLGDLEMLTTYFLPKASIDWATSRMAEILRRRYGGPDPNGGQQTSGTNQAAQSTTQGTPTP